ncbi:hypothetical protein HZF05_02605 [Sphingomonas sp. CGMCC 1.13654]|uniref:Uncharacterized protein n=1 Tax=Sphingomonas chungangi TaxID=2683589 RepID=A0A838L3L0_9SPHN|nr:hypothetical protein [Sphingomonas chungangi]MBA2932979.1 hypothetical protein [Sphingomonas chungangi]MVW56599.1 hypothetical protein [Sphingomonas chungangi]
MKSPHATLDYRVEWPRARLLGVAIEESAWTCRPEGLTIDPVESAPGITAVRIGGGERGVVYCLVNRVTLADDRTLTRSLDLEAA